MQLRNSVQTPPAKLYLHLFGSALLNTVFSQDVVNEQLVSGATSQNSVNVRGTGALAQIVWTVAYVPSYATL